MARRLPRPWPALWCGAGVPGLGSASLLLLCGAPAQAGAVAPAAPARRGPKPAVSDEALLAAIRADIARSPWTGEGHRKVWARLRAIDGIRVARKRLLRLMGEHSPAVAASGPRAHRRAARPADRYRGAERDVGHRRDPDRHRAGWQGLAVRRHRALERRTGWMACRQAGDPLRGAPGRQHGGPKPVRPPRPRRRPRTGAAPRPRQQLHVRAFQEQDSAPGSSRRATPSSESRKPMASSSACSEPSRSRSCTDVSSRPSTKSETPFAPSSPATTPNG